MRTATTKIRVDSRVVRVAIDANASASALTAVLKAGSTCCSCAQFWRSFGRGCNCPLLLSRSLCFFGRQEVQPDAKTRRRTACVVSDVQKEGRVDGKIDRFTPNHELVWISVLCVCAAVEPL